MNPKTLSIIAGASYLGIFFLAIYANFFVLDAIIGDPVGAVADNQQHIRFGAMAFLLAAVLDVIIAWALFELYKNHKLSLLSTYFRITHAVLMGAAVFALVPIVDMLSENEILAQVDVFNTLWLIGLFFFGFHLLLLAKIVKHIRFIPYVLALAGLMYIVDTTAQFTFIDYESYADIFLMLVAIPAVLGEMSFALWLLIKGRKPVNKGTTPEQQLN
jgi:hypothetical protein